MARISGEAVDEAKRTLRQAYYAQVGSEVADLVRAYFDGEYDDEDGQTENIDQTCDAHVTYTSDQWDTLYSSESSSEGAERQAELTGDGTRPIDEQLGQWAYFTFEADIRNTLGNQFGVAMKTVSPAMELNLDDEQRLIWLAANFTARYLGEFNKGDTEPQYSFLVGTINPGEMGEADLGVITLWSDDGARVKVQRDSTYQFFKGVRRRGPEVGGRRLRQSQRRRCLAGVVRRPARAQRAARSGAAVRDRGAEIEVWSRRPRWRTRNDRPR